MKIKIARSTELGKEHWKKQSRTSGKMMLLRRNEGTNAKAAMRNLSLPRFWRWRSAERRWPEIIRGSFIEPSIEGEEKLGLPPQNLGIGLLHSSLSNHGCVVPLPSLVGWVELGFRLIIILFCIKYFCYLIMFRNWVELCQIDLKINNDKKIHVVCSFI